MEKRVKQRIRGLGAVLAVGATVVAGAAFGPAAVASPAVDSQPSAAQRQDNRPGPLTERQNERRKAAQELILSGQAAPNEDGVVAARRRQVLSRRGHRAPAQVFTILSEFGDQGSGKLGTTPGPLHNQIPEPDRAVDNSTALDAGLQHRVTTRTSSSATGESFKDFYEKQSSGALHRRPAR